MKMKKMKNFGILTIVILFIVASCENMMDVHKEFAGDSEIVYAPKLDSLAFYAGQNKVYCQFWTYNSSNVKSVDFYWDEDSLIIPVSPSSKLDSMLVEIPCSEEKSYTIKVRTTDIFGNHSLWTTGFANSYGDFFLESLSNRAVRGFKVTNNDGEISWFPPASNLVRSEVRYTDNSGAENIVNVSEINSTTLCPGLTTNRFEIRSFFLPEPDAIDTFAISWEAVLPLYQFSRTEWSVKYCSSWHGMPSLTGKDNMPHFIFDGNFNTFWHSNYATYAAGLNPLDPEVTRDPCPHTIVIDMGEPVDIWQVDIYRRLNNNNAQTVVAYAPAVDDNLLTQEDFEWRGNIPITYVNHQFYKNYHYPGIENNNWVELGRVEYPSDALDTPEKNLRIIDASSKNIRSRYFKLVLPNSRSNANISLSEVFVWGK